MHRIRSFLRTLQPIVLTLVPYALGSAWTVSAAVVAVQGDYTLLLVTAFLTLILIDRDWETI